MFFSAVCVQSCSRPVKREKRQITAILAVNKTTPDERTSHKLNTLKCMLAIVPISSHT